MASPGGSRIFQWDFTILNHTSFHSHSRPFFLLLIFLSIAILIIALFLYVHWVCGQNLLSTAAVEINATVAAAPPRLDPDIINSLPIILHRSRVVTNTDEGIKHGDCIEETECCICLGAFEDEEKLKVLPQCNHAYHSDCIDNWLSSQSSCPLCRASLTPITTPI
ncbi:hypothetical protein PTKIN_Ptkin03bG0010400 [Pterospermum kingtungense]